MRNIYFITVVAGGLVLTLFCLPRYGTWSVLVIFPVALLLLVGAKAFPAAAAKQGSGAGPEHSQTERHDESALGDLLERLGLYEAALQSLVHELEPGGSRAALNAQLQRLADLDLGRMLSSGPALDKADERQLGRVRLALERIRAAAEMAGKHIEGGARPPSSLQGVLDSAMQGSPGNADQPAALRLIIPNILMVTTSSLGRVAQMTTHAVRNVPEAEPEAGIAHPVAQLGFAAHDGERQHAEVVTIDAGEFDRLSRDCYVRLEEWSVRSLMLVSGGSQNEMVRKLQNNIDSLAHEAPQIGEATLENIQVLDDRLRLAGNVLLLCRNASSQLARFRDTVNGADWQEAVKKSHEAAEALNSARKKFIGAGFGGVSVTINQ